jgi:hypothetical protein
MQPPQQYTQYQPTPQPSAPAGSGNWFTNLAPTIGSVGGGILGTVLGGPLGGIAGATAGGAVGKGIENAGQGANPLQVNDLTAGAESGAGQALGEGVLGLAGKALGAIGGSGAAQAGADAAVKRLLTDQLNMRALPKNIDINNVVDTLMSNGVTDLKQVPGVLGTMTGKEGVQWGTAGVLNNGVDSVMHQLDDIGIGMPSNMLLAADHAISPEFNSQAGAFTDKGNAAKQFINKVLTNNGFLVNRRVGEGSITVPNPDQVSFVKGAAAMKQLRDAARIETNPATKAAYDHVAQMLQQGVLEHPAAALNQEMKDDMIASISKLKGSNPKFYNNMVQTIEGSNTPADLNRAQVPLIEAIQAASSPISKVAQTTAGGIGRGLGKVGNILAGGALGGPAGAAAGLGYDLLETPTGASIGTKVASGAPSALQAVGGALTSKPVMALGGIPGAAAAGAAQLPAGGPVSTNTAGGTTVDQGAGGGALAGAAAPDTAQLLTQLDAMLAADPNLASALAPQLAALSQKSQSINAAQSALAQYAQTLQNAGGARGPFLGALEQLGGLVTGQTNQLGPQAAAVQAAMKNAGLGPVALPGLTASPQGAASSLGQAQSVLGAMGGY